jgi:hypothetical protein
MRQTGTTIYIIKLPAHRNNSADTKDPSYVDCRLIATFSRNGFRYRMAIVRLELSGLHRGVHEVLLQTELGLLRNLLILEIVKCPHWPRSP